MNGRQRARAEADHAEGLGDSGAEAQGTHGRFPQDHRPASQKEVSGEGERVALSPPKCLGRLALRLRLGVAALLAPAAILVPVARLLPAALFRHVRDASRPPICHQSSSFSCYRPLPVSAGHDAGRTQSVTKSAASDGIFRQSYDQVFAWLLLREVDGPGERPGRHFLDAPSTRPANSRSSGGTSWTRQVERSRFESVTGSASNASCSGRPAKSTT